jgi:hypothetical protein
LCLDDFQVFKCARVLRVIVCQSPLYLDDLSKERKRFDALQCHLEVFQRLGGIDCAQLHQLYRDAPTGTEETWDQSKGTVFEVQRFPVFTERSRRVSETASAALPQFIA